MTGYTVRVGDIKRDKDAVIAVWARNLRSHDKPTHRLKFDWYYEQNPVGLGRLWVLESQSGGPVIGVAGLGLRRLRVGDHRLTAGVASDFAVDKEHRTLRPAMLLARAVADSVRSAPTDLDLVYGLPNSQSLGVFKRVGYDTEGSVHRHVKVLRVERFLRSRIPQSIVRQGVAAIADPMILVASRESWRPGRGRELREVQEFDDRFDDLWSRANAGHRVVMERTTDILRWRYSQCPLWRYSILALTGPNGDRLLGYAVCLLKEDQQALVVDFIAAAGDDIAQQDLMAGVLRWARGRGAASVAISAYGAPGVAKLLRDYGFRRRGQAAPLAILMRPGGPAVADLREWYFLPADEDYN